jgi:hypothetical protein
MAIDLEVKHRLRELEARIVALENVLKPEVFRQLVDSYLLASKPLDSEKLAQNKTRIEVNRRLCPHCGIQPNHFFHVRSCAKNSRAGG